MNRSIALAVPAVIAVVAALLLLPPQSAHSQGFTGPLMAIGAASQGNATTAWFVETQSHSVIACTSDGPKAAPTCRTTKF